LVAQKFREYRKRPFRSNLKWHDLPKIKDRARKKLICGCTDNSVVIIDFHLGLQAQASQGKQNTQVQANFSSASLILTKAFTPQKKSCRIRALFRALPLTFYQTAVAWCRWQTGQISQLFIRGSSVVSVSACDQQTGEALK
jgi:hypothetical protein